MTSLILGAMYQINENKARIESRLRTDVLKAQLEPRAEGGWSGDGLGKSLPDIFGKSNLKLFICRHMLSTIFRSNQNGFDIKCAPRF